MSEAYDLAPCGLLTTGAHGEIVHVNETFSRWLGYTREELSAKKLQDLFTVGSKLFHHTQWLPLLQMQRTLAEVQLELVAKDGKVLPVLVNAAMRGDELVDVAIMVVVDRRRYERQLLESRRMAEGLLRRLEEKNRELESFAYVVSHDLKAPLRALANLATWIRQDDGDRLSDAGRAHLDLMDGRIAHMNSLIDSVLRVARAGGREEKQSVDVRALLDDLVHVVGTPAVRIEIGEGMPTLTTSRIALEQVLQNLLSNAVKHASREDAVIAVRVKDRGEHHEFSVSDNGPGIAPQHHERIWKIFQSLNPTADSTGIGLAIVRKIVESRGGRAWLESTPGNGATFFFTWPKEEK